MESKRKDLSPKKIERNTAVMADLMTSYDVRGGGGGSVTSVQIRVLVVCIRVLVVCIRMLLVC